MEYLIYRGKIVIFDVTSVSAHQSLLSFFEKKRTERKTEKKKEKEKSAAFLAHGVADVKVLRGKILFWS